MNVEEDQEVPTDAQQRALNRQALTAATFVEMADTLVDDFDVIDVLTVLTSRSVDLLDVAEAGILLADSAGHLRVMAASSERIELLELFQIQNDQGPCLDCYRTGKLVVVTNLGEGSSWPQFAVESVGAGFPAVCAVPLRLRNMILGCLNLFIADPVRLSNSDITLAQAFADVASIAIVQDQASRDAAAREGQLQHALSSRVVIEQAKGMIAEGMGVDMDVAFSRLRVFSRNTNRGLTEVAEALVGGTLTVDALSIGKRPPPPPSVAAKSLE